MLRGAREMSGWSIEAEDDEGGHLSDVYFGDWRWTVRQPLAGRAERAHITPVRERGGSHPPGLTDEPEPESGRPRSGPRPGPTRITPARARELSHYYGFPSYAVTVGASVGLTEPGTLLKAVAGADPHLRSVRAITGYFVHALDGDVGHVEDFLVDDDTWATVRTTRRGWAGTTVRRLSCLEG